MAPASCSMLSMISLRIMMSMVSNMSTMNMMSMILDLGFELEDEYEHDYIEGND